MAVGGYLGEPVRANEAHSYEDDVTIPGGTATLDR